jgi:maltose-binding protein MalE
MVYNSGRPKGYETERIREGIVKRAAIVATAFIALTGLLVACSSGGTATPVQGPGPTSAEATTAPQPTPTPVPPVTITIWHGWTGDYLANVEKVFGDYEATHDNIKIDLVSVPDMDTRLPTDIPAGASVDIIAFSSEWVGRLADAGLIVPVSDYGITRDFVSNAYIGSAAEGMIYKDKVWGVPETVECVTWIYNKALVSEADIPTNTDGLLAEAQDWNAAHPGQYFFVYAATNDVYFSAPWWYGAGAYMVKEDGSVGLDTPEGIKAAQFIASLPPVMPQPIDYVAAVGLFKEGKAAIIQDGPWLLPELQAAGIDYGLAFIPEFDATGRKAAPFVSGKALILTPNSGHPEAAADLMKYFTSAEVQIFLARANGTIPTNLAAIENPEVVALTDIAHFAQQAGYGVAMPTTPYMSALWEPMSAALESLWNGSVTPEQAVQTAQAQAMQGIAAMKK